MNASAKAIAILAVIAAAVAGLVFCASGTVSAAVNPDSPLSGDDLYNEAFKFLKNIGIWFMLMMVAFLMMFIKKFEWGVCLAVLLSAASSYLVYAGILQFYFGAEWNQDLMIRAVVCAITYVIAIGGFIGIVKQWHYFLGGIAFAFVYALVEWICCNTAWFGTMATDPGGTMMVHMCAAYFGVGAAIAIRDQKAFDEPMYTTTHSIAFVWLSAMLLWLLWPTFVCGLLPMEQFSWGTMTCYMSGLGSIISTYIVCMVCQGKVNPLVYTYAMLAGPVAIGCTLLYVGPWAALVIGFAAGAVSALCFLYMQNPFCKLIGARDIMGIHNLHGMGGWVGVVAIVIIFLFEGHVDNAVANICQAFAVVAIALVGGAVTGLIIRLCKGKPMEQFSDDYDFIRSEDPELGGR